MNHSELHAKVTVNTMDLVKPLRAIIIVIPLLANATNNETRHVKNLETNVCALQHGFWWKCWFNAISLDQTETFYLRAIYIL